MSLLQLASASVTSQNHTETLQKAITASIEHARDSTKIYQKHSVGQNLAVHLERTGILINDSVISSHPHPANHTIANYFNLQLIPNFINGDTAFYYHKDFKVKAIVEALRHQKKKINYEIKNKHHVVKDLYRYQTVTQETSTDMPTAVFFESLHYMTPDQIYLFFKLNPKVQRIIATIVVPPEIDEKQMSLYPHAYQLVYKDDIFIYIPEGHFAGKYEQPLRSIEWLKINEIKGNDLTLKVTKMESTMAHHLITIDRTDLPTNRYNIFDSPDLFKIPNIYRTNLNITYPFMPRNLVKDLMLYSKALTTPKEVNFWAKIRDLLQHPDRYYLSFHAAQALIDIALIIVSADYKNYSTLIETGSLTKNLWNSIKGPITDPIEQIFYNQKKKFMDLIDSEPYTITFKLTSYKYSRSFYKTLLDQIKPKQKKPHLNVEFLELPLDHLLDDPTTEDDLDFDQLEVDFDADDYKSESEDESPPSSTTTPTLNLDPDSYEPNMLTPLPHEIPLPDSDDSDLIDEEQANPTADTTYQPTEPMTTSLINELLIDLPPALQQPDLTEAHPIKLECIYHTIKDYIPEPKEMNYRNYIETIREHLPDNLDLNSLAFYNILKHFNIDAHVHYPNPLHCFEINPYPTVHFMVEDDHVYQHNPKHPHNKKK